MSDKFKLEKGNLASILALEWKIQHDGECTYLTRDDLPAGVIVIDWKWRAIVYASGFATDISIRIRESAQENYFDAMRLLEAEGCAIDDIMRPDRGHKDLNDLFAALFNLRASGKSPASIFVFAGQGASGTTEYHYALVEFDEKTGFQTHKELAKAVQDFNGSTMADLVSFKKAQNKIAFIVKSAGLYDHIIEIARLRDGDGWTWDEKASIYTADKLYEFGEESEAMPFYCEQGCGFSKYYEMWQLGCEGGHVAACYRAWQAHKEQHPRCEGHLNF